jgi:phage terminase large subunit-like protein
MLTSNKITAYLKDPAQFRKEQRILDNGKPYGKCFDQWQEDDIFGPLEHGTKDFYYFELARGNDKTGSVAWFCLQSIILGPHDQDIGIYAVDKEQGKILLDSIKGDLRRNPAIAHGIEIQHSQILLPEKNCRIEISSSDAASSFGIKKTMIIVEELHQWANKDLWDSLLSATGKMPGCKFIVITNAPIHDSLCWEIREMARLDSDWHFYSAPGSLASWISAEWKARMKRMLHPIKYKRLIENQCTCEEDAFVTKEQIDVVTNPARTENIKGEAGQRYFYALDLGLRRDRTARCIVHFDEEKNRVVLDSLRVWVPRGEDVLIEHIEQDMLESAQNFYIRKFICDPWQLQSTIQKLRHRIMIEEFTFTPKSLQELTGNLYHLVDSRRIELYPDAGRFSHKGMEYNLQRELGSVVIKELAAGYRIDHRSGGFSDMVIAFGMAALKAMDPNERYVGCGVSVI